jgi:hypothetical protein
MQFQNIETTYHGASKAPLAMRAVTQYGTKADVAAARGASGPKAGDPVALVNANHGRWLVTCPLDNPMTGARCGGAQYSHPDAPTYFCLTCKNLEVEGRLVAVNFPKDHDKIEAYLLARPQVNARNWQPNETISDLRAQNRAAGIRLS